MARELKESVPAFGTLELGSKTWGRINPVGTRGPNMFPYDEGPDSITVPIAGPIVGSRSAEELQQYNDDETTAVLEAAHRLSSYTNYVFKMIMERLNNEV